MLGGYQPRRVVREGEREIPSEVDSKADQRILMEMVPRGGPHRRLIPRRLENPEEADYTNQRAFLLTRMGLPADHGEISGEVAEQDSVLNRCVLALRR